MPVVRVSVNPPLCLGNEAPRKVFTVASPSGFFAAQLDTPLVGGESVSVWTEKRPDFVAREPVRADLMSLQGLGLGNVRVYALRSRHQRRVAKGGFQVSVPSRRRDL